MLAIPLVAAVFCVFRPLDFVAPEPYWLYITVVIGGGAISILSTAWWDESHARYRSVYVGANMSVIATIAYSTGWGPILSIGFVFGAASAFQLIGSRATIPCLVWTVVVVVLGQMAIALHFAPTMLQASLVQGVAGLGLLGALIVIELLGRATAGREALETELRRSERRFSALVTSSGDIVVVTNPDGKLQYASPAFESVLGYSGADIGSLIVEELLHPDDRPGVRVAMATAGQSSSVVNEEIRVRCADGDWLWFEAAITDLMADPDVNGFVASLRDITRRKQAEDRLAHAALHDALTGLPNRTLIINRVELMLARTRRQRIPVAALFLDLDDFKDVNDTLGHDAGDQLLVGVANRLTSALREGDTVGRLGGDEFVVLVEGASLAAGAEVVCQRILDLFATPFDIAATRVPLEVTGSIGVAEGDRAQPGDLLRDADIALYRAKAAGKHCAVAFSPSMLEAVDDHRNIEVDLHHALENDEFRLLYQPTIALSDGSVTGVEALLRWSHPGRGVVQPNDFVPTLESSGQIVPVGEWVLHEACRQGVAWHALGHRITMSVNISAVQLERDRIVDDVHRALSESGLEPGMLILELTETTLMHDVESTVVRLELLKGLGVRLAIDDFGTGYSSLAYLRKFPIDVLKIDQSFVAGIAETKECAAVVHTLVQLGKVLGLETVAEGIESDDQRRRLEEENVNFGQGSYFSQPLEAEAVNRLLGERDRQGVGENRKVSVGGGAARAPG